MIELKSYRDLTVWEKSMDLGVICYQLTSQFPKTEIYGLRRVNFFDFKPDT